MGYTGVDCLRRTPLPSNLHATFSDPVALGRDWSSRLGSEVKGGNILHCGNLFAGEYLLFNKVSYQIKVVH